MLKKNLVANFIGQGCVNLISILFIPLYLKYLGVEAYALISFFTLIYSIVMLFDMGMVQSLTQRLSTHNSKLSDSQSIRNFLRSVEIILFIIAGLALLIVFSSSSWLAQNWLKVDVNSVRMVTKAIEIMSIVLALRFIENIYYNCLVGMQEQIAFNLINCSMAVFRNFGALVVLILISPTIDVFFIWQGIVSIITIIILLMVVYKKMPGNKLQGRFEFSEVKAVWRFSAGLMIIGFLNFLLTQIDKILLSRFLTLENFGLYSLASVVASALLLLVTPVELAFYPKLNSLVIRKYIDELKSLYHMASQFVSVLIGTAALTMILFGDLILKLWIHDSIIAEKISILVMLLSLGALLNSLVCLPYRLQLSHSWTNFMIGSKLIALIILIPTFLIVIPIYGVLGAAVLGVIFNFINLLITIEFTHKRILPDEKWSWYFNDVLLPILSILFMGLLVRNLFIPFINGRVGELILLALSIILMMLAGLISSQILRKNFLFFYSKALNDYK